MMPPEKRSATALAGARGAGTAKINDLHGNSAASQLRRLLSRLRAGPLSTFDARRDLDVAHPAARIMELRERGYTIATTWSVEQSLSGTPHRVAKYALLAEPNEVRR